MVRLGPGAQVDSTVNKLLVRRPGLASPSSRWGGAGIATGDGAAESRVARVGVALRGRWKCSGVVRRHPTAYVRTASWGCAMMKKATHAVLLLGFACGCTTETKIERAIEVALAPENPRVVLREFRRLSTGNLEADRLRLKEALGSYNFTSWYFLTPQDALDELELGDFAWTIIMSNPAENAQYFGEHSTAVDMDDVSGIEWTKQTDDTFTGQFSVDVPNLTAEFLFAARQRNGRIEITKLVVAPRSSMELSNGFVIFEKDISTKKKPEVFVIPQERIKPPPRQEQQIPKPKAKKVPIPDPTPDEPEPIRIPDSEKELEIPDIGDLLIAVPESAPPVETGPMYVTGDVQKPIKIQEVQPQYTDLARKARIQGVVIMQTIIDKEGNVIDVKLLKSLPMGLGDAAVEAVKQWKYEPAMLNGKPVAVYFNLTVNFRLP